MKILFVCTGNTCRSPMAEHLFRKMLKDENIVDVEADSAGIYPAAGLNFPNEARKALRLEGVGEIAHSPRGLTQARMESSELVLAMEEGQKEIILKSFPDQTGKVFLLKEYAGIDDGNPRIPDPLGQSNRVYQATLAEIKKALVKLLERLKQRKI